MELELVKPGSCTKAEELEHCRIWCRGGSISAHQGGRQKQASHGKRADRDQHCGDDLDGT